uniref:Uncharacterized protein n=1 Tax=viral metagenome TaxID=1070528 RepID=A0A6H1ZAB2_9ZZZZ
MTINDNGRQVKRIWWNGANGDESLTTEGQRTLRFVGTYHGDRDEFWVEEYINNKQVAIHNCRYITSIEWAMEG